MIRRYAAEALGTFGIVFAPVALSATGKMPGGDSGLMAAALVSGLAVLAMVYALGPISAAHFNPAVTLGFAVARRFPWRFVWPYWLSQLVGAILAASLAALLFGPGHGLTLPSDLSATGKNLGTEIVLTFLLMLVIIAVATDRRVSGAVPGIAIGMMIVVNVLIGGPITGASMNPARSLGPALFAPSSLGNYWIYMVGPCLGAVIAALCFEALRIDQSEAKGAPNELLEALKAVEMESHSSQ
ncbi:MAG TPA: aquaporin [Fimbriimonadaceae bacterium]|jgi:MIP family channel proteins